MNKLEKMFDKVEDDFLEFDKVEHKFSNRPDLHAFILLNKLVPNNGDMIVAAEHDEIWLETDLKKLAEVVTQEQVLELARCGVRYTDDGLCMFV